MSELSNRLKELRAKSTQEKLKVVNRDTSTAIVIRTESSDIPIAEIWGNGKPYGQNLADGQLICELVNNAETIIPALEAAEVRKDWVSVPREPTPDMCATGYDKTEIGMATCERIYKAMIGVKHE